MMFISTRWPHRVRGLPVPVTSKNRMRHNHCCFCWPTFWKQTNKIFSLQSRYQEKQQIITSEKLSVVKFAWIFPWEIIKTTSWLSEQLAVNWLTDELLQFWLMLNKLKMTDKHGRNVQFVLWNRRNEKKRSASVTRWGINAINCWRIEIMCDVCV